MAPRIAPGTKGLGETLIEAGVITPETLAAALSRAEHARERVGEALIALGAASQEDVLRALAKQRGVPFLLAEELPFTLPVLKNLSPKYLRQYEACPVSLEGNTLTVATADPSNPLLVDELRQTLGLQIKLCVAPKDAILAAIERTYGASTALQKIVEGMGPAEGDGDREEDITQLRDMAFEAPVVRLVNLLIEEAVSAEASDIHIEPSEDTLRVRYRIDGLLYDLEAPPRRLQAAVTSRIKLMAELNIAERRLPQDGRIRMTLNSRRVDIRVSSIPTIHGESLVMRLLDRSSVFMPFDKLGFSPKIAAHFDRLIKQPNRIILVTGPTGSGKTTTLYAALDKINSAEKKIITIEDPVEYQLKGVNQIAVRPKIGLTFASGLRHIVRQDPDVVMVGEIRDLETAEIAVHGALTGHLCFSTLHTNDAPGAITRLQDMGVEPYLIASVLSGVLAQRLVRRICESCRVPHVPDPGDLLAIGVSDAHGAELFRGEGCEACRKTGYKSRVGIYELFIITEDIRSLILRKASTGEIRRAAVEQGMVTLREDGWAKARAGLTTVEEILRVTQEDS
ncbi:MAG TPA: type II secretion system ATPase GspE [Methylomirabilota bacterium]|jgi:general secretion pathway protein E|nr:type II secretion system ATPase GspE [Methylomirabilota bacterium]